VCVVCVCGVCVVCVWCVCECVKFLHGRHKDVGLLYRNNSSQGMVAHIVNPLLVDRTLGLEAY